MNFKYPQTDMSCKVMGGNSWRHTKLGNIQGQNWNNNWKQVKIGNSED